MRRFILSVSAVIILGSYAFAAEKPQELNSFIQSSQPYGEGALSRLMFTAYDATLWTDASQWSYDVPFALALTYRMSFTTVELVERSIEEMERGEKISTQQKDQYTALLTSAFPNVKDGDRITALYKPEVGISFYHNGKLTNKSSSPAFAKRFLNIWLGSTTSEPSLRRGLLARK
jgi:Chalcone isomerase-like